MSYRYSTKRKPTLNQQFITHTLTNYIKLNTLLSCNNSRSTNKSDITRNENKELRCWSKVTLRRSVALEQRSIMQFLVDLAIKTHAANLRSLAQEVNQDKGGNATPLTRFSQTCTGGLFSCFFLNRYIIPDFFLLRAPTRNTI